MAISDFIAKERAIAADRGIGAALRAGAGEVSMKALGAATPWLGTPIWAGDWDVCLVLDACRYDLWQEVAAADYGSGSAWSVGSASPEWIGNTFADRHRADWSRTGYVTANPFSGKTPAGNPVLDDGVYPLADRGLGYLDEVWRDQWPVSDALPTVGPRALTQRGLWAWQRREEFGIDRLVVHYMQPHVPFRARPEWCGGWDLDGFGTGGGYGKDEWLRLRDGELDEVEFWTAYRDNLVWVLNEVARWQRCIDGGLLVTSDHGNAMGEFSQWSHPPNSGNPALRRVPWVALDGVGVDGMDGAVPGDPPVVGGTRDVDAQLAALGYTE